MVLVRKNVDNITGLQLVLSCPPWSDGKGKGQFTSQGESAVELDLKIQVRRHCHRLRSPLFLPDLLIWTIIWHFAVWRLIRTDFRQIYARTVYAELKQNRKWRQNGKCRMTHLRCVIVSEKQSKWCRFAHKLPRQGFLDVFLAEKY